MKNRAANLPPEGHVVSVNGIEMYYETYGQGSPLILIHGFLHTAATWKPYIPTLAEHYRVIALDQRGHGRSTNPANQFTHRQAALDVYALLEHLKIDRFKAMGHSSGGMTLLHMATRQPERVEAMVLIDSTHYYPEPCRAIQRTVAVDAPPPWGGDWEWLIQREGVERAQGDMAAYVKRLKDFAQGVGLAEGAVPESTYWLVRDGTVLVGFSRLRHRWCRPWNTTAGTSAMRSVPPSAARDTAHGYCP